MLLQSEMDTELTLPYNIRLGSKFIDVLNECIITSTLCKLDLM